MKSDDERAILHRFSHLFEERMGIKSIGLECGPGWHPIIGRMLAEIDAIRPPTEARIVQIKQKFGDLRVYYDNIEDAVDEAIERAEWLCAVSCERCGEPARIRRNGWVTVLCDEHYSRSDEEDDIGGRGLQAAHRLVWMGVTLEQANVILAVGSDDEADRRTRIRAVLDIYSSVLAIFSGEEDLVRAWLREQSAAFDGRSALDTMLEGREGIQQVRDHLRARLSGPW